MYIHVGRPSTYSDQLANTICEKIALGQSLRSVCREPGFPAKYTILRWLHLHEDFRAHYARARLEQADTYAERMQEISESTDDPRLQVDVLKWKVARMHPRSWGDKQAIELSGEIKADVNIKDSRDTLKSKLTRFEDRSEVDGGTD